MAILMVGCGQMPTEPQPGLAYPYGTPRVYAPDLIDVTGVVKSADGPVANADVCYFVEGFAPEAGQGQCGTSGSNGAFTLGHVPANVPISVTYAAPGFLPVLRPIRTGPRDLAIPSDEGRLIPLAETAGAEAQPSEDLGFVQIFGSDAVFGTGTASGASVSAYTVDSAPVPLSYLPRSAPATAKSGAIAVVGAGYYTLVAERGSSACTVTGGFDGKSDAASIPVYAGYVTTPVVAKCE